MSLVQGTDGDLYGVTSSGGPSNSCNVYGCGTVFKITTGGALTILHNFHLIPDGQSPLGTLVQATNGSFYGTTEYGGDLNCALDPISGCGTVFKITPGGKLTTLVALEGANGKSPYAGLVQATNGGLYGTTLAGGASNSCNAGNGCGTVFRMTPAGALTTLVSFDSTDGAYPFGLVQATNGNFYGTTLAGGASNSCYGGSSCGTVFKMTPAGALTTLHSFDLSDGANPQAALIQATDGNFYGTTSGLDYNGNANGYGTVFGITPSGTLATVYGFSSGDGANPMGALVQATDGNLYGTTRYGGGSGGNGYGCVFQVTLGGTLTILRHFNGADGAYPYGGLVQATDGNFYGTTEAGGANGHGTVFSVSVGLGPFVKTSPASGTVGAAIKILGTNLTGATSITFHGTSSTFTVVSPSLITTTVPQGATTGYVRVTTPGGTLFSNVPFRVTP